MESEVDGAAAEAAGGWAVCTVPEGCRCGWCAVGGRFAVTRCDVTVAETGGHRRGVGAAGAARRLGRCSTSSATASTPKAHQVCPERGGAPRSGAMPTSVPAELLEGRKLHSKVAPSLSDAGREEEQAVASPSLLRHVGWRRSAALHQRWVKWIPGFL